MLLGIKKRTIFVSNLKSASSAIERRLGEHCEIAISSTEFGKHMSIAQIEERFRWVFDYAPLEEFLVFAVIREPLHYLISLYNFHSGPAFDGLSQSTRRIPFDAYIDGVLDAPDWMTLPQADRLLNGAGRLRVTHLIDHACVGREVRAICRFLRVDHGPLDVRNASPRVARIEDYRPDQLEAIRARYAADYALMASPPRDARIVALCREEQGRFSLPRKLGGLVRRG